MSPIAMGPVLANFHKVLDWCLCEPRIASKAPSLSAPFLQMPDRGRQSRKALMNKTTCTKTFTNPWRKNSHALPIHAPVAAWGSALPLDLIMVSVKVSERTAKELQRIRTRSLHLLYIHTVSHPEQVLFRKGVCVPKLRPKSLSLCIFLCIFLWIS